MADSIFQVDAFTAEPFKGNPAAVCLPAGPRDDPWMQNVAAEMNLSETAFLRWRDDGWDLRWFTPTVEVDLCGHATLASAHVLWEAHLLGADEQARFHTRSGRLTADRRGEWIRMDFPAAPCEPAEAPPGLCEALGAAPVAVGSVRGAVGGTWLLELESESAVRALRPDFARLRQVPRGGAIVTSTSDSPEYDFVSRFFLPAAGIDEDPVTGASHCSLAPYWARKLGKAEMTAYQASARGGVIRVAPAGERVKISGRAVTVLRGELV